MTLTSRFTHSLRNLPSHHFRNFPSPGVPLLHPPLYLLLWYHTSNICTSLTGELVSILRGLFCTQSPFTSTFRRLRFCVLTIDVTPPNAMDVKRKETRVETQRSSSTVSTLPDRHVNDTRSGSQIGDRVNSNRKGGERLARTLRRNRS